MTTFTARAYAKVNLHLGVGDARPDGFHELATVFQSLDIFDVVTLQLGSSGISVSGPHAGGVPTDFSNLAWKAALLVAEKFPGAPEFALHLEKNIPAAGGMAGGSADAAATLVLANTAFATATGRPACPRKSLFELAAHLGSDVPFTLMGGTALGTGRGENLTPMLARGRYTWAIITNDRGLSTPEVFRKLDQLRAAGRDIPARMDTSTVAQALVSGDPHVLAGALANDLQPAALSLRPDLRKVLETGKSAGALAGIVSGSGPTCAFLCADADDAFEVVAQVTADNRGTRGLVTSGPAPGATLMG
ncbi:4-diphosphocytidyl-2C-methyl-D-erythritol kinase [Corynebacterium phocae]|uniref:4-diphosphocytidyl-2-C-methyl-D-erythritol kinase n=1 Tax=Corynebacterium phocae TaxID=161895 RepID=A0A1L7D4L2_9CORY|nr:4-(cytidine 5'-diphospho)-2-C-methyl-D-erythritol kinase [Corynebacterium phocae]APT92951.1 4-diphosphocytidyl-2C-methyl-D-erythritol kinase [Corynebacterium phocae]KAA8723284.1 4-(cytidine 5'-diphospho)-2-C-methyl-D-erythritol kinase [Corynebacterium phocae]